MSWQRWYLVLEGWINKCFSVLTAGMNLIQHITVRQCPPRPASSGFILTLIKQLISSDLHALTRKEPGQVIRGERLKIHSRAKTTVFMDPCCDNQPSLSDFMTDGGFLPFQIICRPTLGAAAPWHRSKLSLGHQRYSRHYSTIVSDGLCSVSGCL